MKLDGSLLFRPKVTIIQKIQQQDKNNNNKKWSGERGGEKLRATKKEIFIQHINAWGLSYASTSIELINVSKSTIHYSIDSQWRILNYIQKVCCSTQP